MAGLLTSAAVGLAAGCGSANSAVPGEALSGAAGGTTGVGGTASSGGSGGDSGQGGAGAAASGTGAGGATGVGGGASGGDSGDLGAYPVSPTTPTRGGTMTFTNVGASGWWPRRLERPAGDPACDVKDGTDSWGGRCCLSRYDVPATALSPFDRELTLILKTVNVKQLAVYQPEGAASGGFRRTTSFDARGTSKDLWFTVSGDGSSQFPADLTKTDCVGYLSREPVAICDGYACPNDPGVLHLGYTGTKLFVMLLDTRVDDAAVKPCSGSGTAHPGPWIAIVASELIRDGGRKWNGACNCYSKTGSVGDGCGEINLFEVVMDGNQYSNREFASLGVRSFQAGHVGGAVCGASCTPTEFPANEDVVDACAKQGYPRGPELRLGGTTDGCPVWRRPDGDRYFLVLFDEVTRSLNVALVHPGAIPPSLGGVLPRLPSALPRSTIDAIAALRLPG